ncbi:MAG: hypothetical protein E5W15_30625, partial [Mesorhizobium sp.]
MIFAKSNWPKSGLQGELIMKNIVVVGAGKIGSTIAEMLSATGDYRVTLVD